MAIGDGNRLNLLNPAIDIAGTLAHQDSRTLADELAGYGKPTANSGAAATLDAKVAGVVTVGSLTGMTANSVGQFMSFTLANSAGNNGVFMIVEYVDATHVKIANAGGVVPDTNSGSIAWVERDSYSIEDDVNFARTDRALIKGTTYDAAIPVYTRPSDLATSVPANLTNIASKTTDAKALCVNKVYRGMVVAAAATHKEIVSVGNMKHAGSNDRTGIPINDGADVGANEAVYVEITKSDDGSELEVLAGLDKGKRIFGRTRAGTPVAATGTMNVVTGAELLDTDYFTLNDGVNTPTIFEFDSDSTVTPGRVGVTYTAGDTSAQVQASVISAINGVGTTLLITASAGTDPVVNLANDTAGAQGNATQSENVADTDFTLSNMTGGAGGASPDSVDVEFRAVAIGADLSTSVAYTWEATQASPVDLAYAYRRRIDQFLDTDLRVTMTQGLQTDADLRQDVTDIQQTIGEADGATSLNGLLTNLTNYFCFSDLPDATPSVVEALNTLNTQIGDRVYADPGKAQCSLTDGETITASLQKIADALAGFSINRTVERVATQIKKGDYHLLPGSITYTVDGTYNGQNMWVFWRGVLRHPGPLQVLGAPTGNEYEETDATHITPYQNINVQDIIDYMILR
jgi:hypothetical protein